MASGFELLVFAAVDDVVAGVGFEVEMRRAYVVSEETFCDRNRQPRTKIHTKPSNKSDQPVD